MKNLHRLLSASVGLLATSQVHAANLTWDTVSGDSAVTGSAGTWDNTTSTWTTDGGTTNSLWDNTANAADTAVFQGTGGTVSLANAINLQGLTFSTAGYTLQNQTLAFGGTQGSIDTSALGTGSNVTTIASALTGTGGLTINANGNTSASGGSSTGRLTLSGTNTSLTGGIAITGGLVNFGSSSAAGSAATTAGSGNVLTLSNGGGIYNSAALTLGNNIVLGTGGGTLRSNSGQTLTLNGVISGSGGFNKTDSGTVTLANNANTFTGGVNVQAGTLRLGNLSANGTFAFTGNALSVSSGANLTLGSASGGTITANYTFANLSAPISLSGGTLAFAQTNNTTQNMGGAIAVSGASTINLTATGFSGHTAALNGAITGNSGSLTFTASGATGRNFAIGSASNNYTGSVILGTADASSVFNLNNALGTADWTLNDADWTVNVSNATHTFKSLSSSVNPLITASGASARLDVGSGNTNTSYAGRLGGTLGLTKSGTGALTLTATHSYTGTTIVAGGSLIVNGSISTSAQTTVQSGATLGGSGSVGALTVNAGGNLNPGNSPGILNTGNFSLQGTLNAEINGIAAGTLYDQVNVTGTVDLTGGALSVLLGYTPSHGDLIFLVANDGSEAVTGTFNGMSEGFQFSAGGQQWQITYQANAEGTPAFTGGNDVALMAVPEPAAGLLGGLGLLALLRRRR